MTAEFRQILESKSCLVIDDKVDSRSMVKKFFMKYGLSDIQSAKDGDEATRKIKDNSFDIIIADFNLGRGKDGQQILEESRFTESLPNTSAFIILTGENASDMVMGAIENSPDDYISKPFTLEDFQKRLTRSLKVKNMLKDIEHSIDIKEHDQAIELCQQLLAQKTPIKMKVLRTLARELLKTKRYKQAEEVYKTIIDAADLNWAQLGLATCLFHQKKYKSAETILKETIKKNPKYAQCYDLLGDIYVVNEKPGLAIEQLSNAVHYSPRSVLRQIKLGKLAFKHGDFATSEQAFERAIAMGKYSCYIDRATFIDYVKTMQQKIKDKNNRESNGAVNSALKATAAMRVRFEGDSDIMFDAELMDSSTFMKRGHVDEAKKSVKNAERIVEKKGATATTEQRLKLIESYVETEQMKKAEDSITDLKTSGGLSAEEKKRIEAIAAKKESIENKKDPEQLHYEGIEFYKAKNYRRAMYLFDEAVASEDATEYMLVNALQAKLSVIEAEGPTKKLTIQTNRLINRIGDLKQDNPRFDRYAALKKKQERLQVA